MAAVSIIIPTFNREHLIEKTIRSALSQTITDIEIIVSDNASTDNTYQIAVAMSKLDSRIKVHRNAENLGPVRNWMSGINLATSPLSKLLFSDDMLAPTYLERCIPYLDDSRCGLVYTPAIIGTLDWQGQKFYGAFEGNARISSPVFVHCTTFVEQLFPVSPCSCLTRTLDLKKNLYLNIAGFEMNEYASTGAGVDWLIYPLTALNYPYIQYIDSCEVFFRLHDNNLCSLPVASRCYGNARSFITSALINRK